MKYIVAAMTIVNDLHYADGRVIDNVIGGGVYCLGGVKPFYNDVCYVTVSGPDFKQYYGDFFAGNSLSTAGVLRRLPKTHHNIVDYEPDGRWREYSVYGESYYQDTFEATQITGTDMARFCGPDTLGIYTESGLEEVFWSDASLLKMRRAAPNAKIMWELPYNNVMQPALRARFYENVKKCDMYSVNEPEGRIIFGEGSRDGVVGAIVRLGVPCFFRCGEDGAAMIAGGRAVFGPSYGLGTSVDPTGCGNCSTAAAMAAFAEGLPLEDVVARANVAAWYNARQLGPYPVFTPEKQREAHLRATEYTAVQTAPTQEEITWTNGKS